MNKSFFLKFVIVFYFMTLGCTIAWEEFVDGTLYDCTDPLFGYLSPDGWVGGNNFPVVVVKHVVPGRIIADSDQIKQGWNVAGLWCLWCLWSTLFSGSLIASFLLARKPWPSSFKEMAPNRKVESSVPV